MLERGGYTAVACGGGDGTLASILNIMSQAPLRIQLEHMLMINSSFATPPWDLGILSTASRYSISLFQISATYSPPLS